MVVGGVITATSSQITPLMQISMRTGLSGRGIWPDASCRSERVGVPAVGRPLGRPRQLAESSPRRVAVSAPAGANSLSLTRPVPLWREARR